MKPATLLSTILLLASIYTLAMAQQTQPLSSKSWEFHQGDLGGVWEAWRSERASFDISHDIAWSSVEMPHCWNAFDAADPDGEYYQGPGWYRTHIQIDNPHPNGRTLLRFQGAGQKTEAFIGLDSVGTHVGGYDEFVFDITDALASQGIANGQLAQLAVRCDNSRDLEMMPSDLSDFFLYGGLYRHVELVYVPALSLQSPHIAASVQGDGNAKIAISSKLYNPRQAKRALKLEVAIAAPDGQTVYSDSVELANWSDRKTLFEFTLDAPALWSPKTPSLYRCKLKLTGEGMQSAQELSFGIRSFRFEKQGPFFLNGERLLLRGTHRHEDHAGLAAAVREDLLRAEFQLMKAMGVNFIRLGHYQQARQVLELCDELGLLVWEEIPWCRGGVGGPAFREQGRRMLANMIEQHYNHPSIILWGLGNEQDWPGDYSHYYESEVRAYMAELHALAKELDPKRLTAIRRCDFAKDIVDVYSPSIWAGWYRGVYPEYKQLSHEQMLRVDHFLHAEWGGSSHSGRHSESPDAGLNTISTGSGDERAGDYLMTGGQARVSRDSDWSETYICNLFDWGLKEQETMAWLTGAAQWAFKDFGTPLRPENPIPYMNQKGLVQRDLKPKESYYVFQSYWTEKPMARIYGHSWPVRWGEEGEPKMIKVYSNCDTAELFLNGKSLGVRARKSQNFPAAGLRWVTPLQAAKNSLKVIAQKEGTVVEDALEFIYQAEKWSAPAQLKAAILSREGQGVRVGIKVLDASGILCCDAKTYLRFELVGDGELVENLGIPEGSKCVQAANGQAVATVKAWGNAVLSIKAEGLETLLFPIGPETK